MLWYENIKWLIFFLLGFKFNGHNFIGELIGGESEVFLEVSVKMSWVFVPQLNCDIFGTKTL